MGTNFLNVGKRTTKIIEDYTRMYKYHETEILESIVKRLYGSVVVRPPIPLSQPVLFLKFTDYKNELSIKERMLLSDIITYHIEPKCVVFEVVKRKRLPLSMVESMICKAYDIPKTELVVDNNGGVTTVRCMHAQTVFNFIMLYS